MTMFLELKEKLKAIYAEYGTYILPAAKFLLALAVFLNINHTLDYVPVLGSIFVVLILSLICAIIPLNGTVFFAMVLILLQCTGVHILAAAFGAVLFLTLWVLYLRFASGEALALVLTPLAFALNIPAAVPIAFHRGCQRVQSFLFIFAFTDQCNLISAFDTSAKHTEYTLCIGRGIAELKCYH